MNTFVTASRFSSLTDFSLAEARKQASSAFAEIPDAGRPAVTHFIAGRFVSPEGVASTGGVVLARDRRNHLIEVPMGLDEPVLDLGALPEDSMAFVPIRGRVISIASLERRINAAGWDLEAQPGATRVHFLTAGLMVSLPGLSLNTPVWTTVLCTGVTGTLALHHGLTGALLMAVPLPQAAIGVIAALSAAQIAAIALKIAAMLAAAGTAFIVFRMLSLAGAGGVALVLALLVVLIMIILILLEVMAGATPPPAGGGAVAGGGGGGLTQAQIDDMKARLAALLARLATLLTRIHLLMTTVPPPNPTRLRRELAVLEKAVEQIIKEMKELLKEMVDAGLLTQEEADTLVNAANQMASGIHDAAGP